MIRRMGLWWRSLVHRQRFETELEEELAFHLQARTQRLLEQGLDASAARRQARLELGMVETHRQAVRQARGLSLWDGCTQALRLAWRSLRHTPGFTLTAVAVLSLPLALGVLLYTMFATYALSAPPIERPQSWLYLEAEQVDHQPQSDFSVVDAHRLLADPPPQVEGLFTHAPVWEAVTVAGTGHRGLGAAVSDNFFALHGVPPLSGRLWFGADDPRDEDTLILTERGWHKLFDRAPQAVGRSVQIGERSYTVIGVLGRGFVGIMEVGTLYYVRDQDRPRVVAANTYAAMVEVGGFLRDGASLAALNGALHGRASTLATDLPPAERLATVRAVQRHGILREADRQEALLAGSPIAVVALLILVVASANLANLVLSRFAARRHDLALRAALGAGRLQLFAHLLTECLLLGLLGGIVALLVVLGCMQLIHDAVFGLLSEMGMDLLPLRFGVDAAWFALALAVFAALCFGGLPAWWVSGHSMGARSGSGATIVVARVQRRGLRGVLMTVQLGLSVFLVVLAGLVATNARQAAKADLGFDPQPLVALRAAADVGALARVLRQQPGVLAVAATSGIPFLKQMPVVNVRVAERSERLRVRYIDAHWWDTLALRAPTGRAFRSADETAATTALLSRRAAELLWPGESALERSLQLLPPAGEDGQPSVTERQVQVIGIMDDLSTGWLIGEAERAVVYLPAPVGSAEAPVLLLRLADTRPARVAQLHQACRDLDVEQNCQPIRLTDALRVQRAPFAVAATLATTLAWLALAISCVGLYGLVSFAVEQQRRELGVRFALGARHREVLLPVMRGALKPLGWGLLLGMAASWAGSRLLAQFSEYLRHSSLEAFLFDPLILVLIALLAAWLPARRATRVAPTECLRNL